MGASGRAPAFRDRPRRALGRRAAHARRRLHLRRHHVRDLFSLRLQTLRQGVRARHACRRLHGLVGRELQDLASVWRASGLERCPVSSTTSPATAANVRTLTARIEERITLKQGGGGRAMRALIEDVFVRDLLPLSVPGRGLEAMDDGAALWLGDRWLIVTTDSHVVHPVFFPGGDIGRLAVSGTVNDLAMMGATEPLALTCAVILEEGFSRADLERVQASIRETCREAGAVVVTGDTKVMGKGELDGIVLNTTGVGLTDRPVRDCGLRPGDVLIVTGAVGDHGLAVMAARHGLSLDGDLASDVAPVNGLIRLALEAGGDDVVAMKDPTRGGLASSLHEMAGKSGVGIILEEPKVPVHAPVRAAG